MDAPSTIKLLEVTGTGRALARAIGLCKQHDRASDKKEGWEAAAKSGGGTLASIKAAAGKEARARSASETTVAAAAGAATGLSLLTAKFRARFVRQGKKMYKDPPLLPPSGVVFQGQERAASQAKRLDGGADICAWG